jgi:hypothetical protein
MTSDSNNLNILLKKTGYIYSIKLNFSSVKNLGLQVLVGLISLCVYYFMVHLTTISVAFSLQSMMN